MAFDLLGCGLSEMPDLEYSAELFVEQIVDAMREFAAEPMTVVASSLGAAFAIRAAARAPERVGHLVLSCPTGLGILDAEPRLSRRALTMFLHAPVAGEAAFNGLASRGSLAWFLRTQSYAAPASVTPEVVDHYYAVTHQPGARFVPAYFVGGGLNCDVARDLPFVEAPVLIVWGERASKTSPVEKAHEFVRLAKDGQLVTLPASGLLPLEEEPEKSCEAIEAFLTPPVADAPVAPPLRFSGPRCDLQELRRARDLPGPVQRRHRVRHRTRLRRAARASRSVVVGRDMRPSGEKLFEAFARGANDAGADVTDVGLVSTDALYFAVGKYGFAGGVMITASHNPAEYNGMKFTRDRAQAISLDTGSGPNPRPGRERNVRTAGGAARHRLASRNPRRLREPLPELHRSCGHQAVQDRDRRRQRDGRPDRAARLQAPALPGHPALLRTRRDLSEPSGQPDRAGEHGRPAAGGPRQSVRLGSGLRRRRRPDVSRR